MSVDEIRLEEATAIVQAYRERRELQRYELGLVRRQGDNGLRVMRKIRATTMELIDAEGYEARCRERLHVPVGPPRKRQNIA